jgi:hypothetical protein
VKQCHGESVFQFLVISTCTLCVSEKIVIREGISSVMEPIGLTLHSTGTIVLVTTGSIE